MLLMHPGIIKHNKSILKARSKQKERNTPVESPVEPFVKTASVVKKRKIIQRKRQEIHSNNLLITGYCRRIHSTDISMDMLNLYKERLIDLRSRNLRLEGMIDRITKTIPGSKHVKKKGAKKKGIVCVITMSNYSKVELSSAYCLYLDKSCKDNIDIILHVVSERLKKYPNIKSLRFYNSFNQPISLFSDNIHIKYMKFGQLFNQKVKKWPHNLEKLMVGDSFIQTIKYLPPTMRWFVHGMFFSKHINPPPDYLRDKMKIIFY